MCFGLYVFFIIIVVIVWFLRSLSLFCRNRSQIRERNEEIMRKVSPIVKTIRTEDFNIHAMFRKLIKGKSI